MTYSGWPIRCRRRLASCLGQIRPKQDVFGEIFDDGADVESFRDRANASRRCRADLASAHYQNIP
jgi:hypothetical protein